VPRARRAPFATGVISTTVSGAYDSRPPWYSPKSAFLSSSTADSSGLAKDGTRGPTPHTDARRSVSRRGAWTQPASHWDASCVPSGLPRSSGRSGRRHACAGTPTHALVALGWPRGHSGIERAERRPRRSGARGQIPMDPPSGSRMLTGQTRRCGETGYPTSASERRPADLLDARHRAVEGARSARTMATTCGARSRTRDTVAGQPTG
jgi:hypothetical protein